MLRRLAASLLAPLLVAACTSIPSQDRVVRIPAPTVADSSNIRISDVRPSNAKEARPDPEIRQFVYLGDSALEPRPVPLLTRYLTGAGNASAVPLSIELVRFDVGLSTPEVRGIYSNSPVIFVPVGPTAGSAAIAGVVGQLLVATFGSAGTNRSVVVNLEVRVAAESITVSDFGFLYFGRSISEAVEEIVPRALATLSNKVADATRPPPK